MRIGGWIAMVAGVSAACTSEGPPRRGSIIGSGIAETEASSSGGNSSSGSPGPSSAGYTSETDTFGGEEVTGGCDITANVARVIPTVVLLVDQSRSMDDPFGSTIRWDAVYDTLMNPTTGIVHGLQDEVRFGLTLYSYLFDDGVPPGQCPELTTVAPALDNYAAIDAMYAAETWNDETPTGAALSQVALELAAFAEDGPKIVILATDGVPDTCAQPNPNEGEEEALTAAEQAFAMGIETFIVAVGPEVSRTHQQQMANVGVGKDRNDPVPAPYYEALDPAALVDAFQQIIGGVVNCQFTINGNVQVDRACEGMVSLDGQALQCETDWRLVDPTTLELIGAACESLQDGSAHTVDASFPCGIFIP
jgi:hypothetical protein